jgi:Enoyl-CoA hydratase/isomerase
MSVHYDVAGRVATVRIDRPEVFNALDRPTLEGLRDSFQRVSADHHVGVVVLTGTGDRAFSTGADLDEQKAFLDRPNDYWDWMGRFIEAIEAIKDCAKPTIARLNGMVVGGGNELNIACDLAVAADDIVLKHVGPARGSLPSGGATQWMPLLVGDRRAREIILLDRPVPAARPARSRSSGGGMGLDQPRCAARGARLGGRRLLRRVARQDARDRARHARAAESVEEPRLGHEHPDGAGVADHPRGVVGGSRRIGVVPRQATA